MIDRRAGSPWFVLVHVVLVNLVAGGIAWNHVVMLSTEIMADLGLGIGHWGTLWAGIALGVLVASVPAGSLGDRFGVRRVVACGIALNVASLAARAIAGSFPWMLLAMALFGASMAAIIANLPKTLGLWFPPERLGMANGISLAGFGVGQAIAMFSTPRLLPLFASWRTLTFAVAGLMIALLAYWMLFMRESPADSTTPPTTGIWTSFLQTIRVRDVRLVALCHLLYFGGHLGVIGYLAAYFETLRSMTAQAAGLVISAGSLSYIVGSVLLPTLSDRLGRRKVVYIVATVVNGVAVFSEGYLLGLPLIGASVLWGLSAGAVGLLFVVPVEMKRVGPALAGSAVGIIIGAGFLGGVLTPTIGMWLADRRPIAAFAFFAGCYLLSALLFLAVRETGKGR